MSIVMLKLVLLCSVLLLFKLYVAVCAPLSLTRIEETYVLAGQSPPPSIVISCVIYSGVSASTIKWHHNDQDITIDNQKYQPLSVTRLRVNGITAADEGRFSCSFVYAGSRIHTDLVCIYVLGAAEFASKGTSTKDSFQGDSVDLDTRIVYTGAGASNNNQTITLLQLFKLDSTNGMKLVYFCSNEGSQKDSPNCPSNDKVITTKGSHKFDQILTLKNLSMEDGGEYLARIEVLHPGVSSRSYITKNFNINVHEPIQLIVRQEDNSLQCEASATGADLSLFSLEWTDSEGQLLSSNTNFRLISDSTAEKISLTAVYDVLTEEIEGNYFCTTSLNLAWASGINKTVNTFLSAKGNSSVIKDNEGTFQLAIGPVSTTECSLWYDREASSKMEATIRDGITAAVAEHCKCTVQPSDFSVGQLRCAGEWLYIRSLVQDAKRKEVILPAIDDWLKSATPTVTMGVFSLKVNSSCSTTKKTVSLSNCLELI